MPGRPAYEEFERQYERLRSGGFPVSVDVEVAWTAFSAQRQGYAERLEQLAAAVLAPPAPWLR